MKQKRGTSNYSTVSLLKGSQIDLFIGHIDVQKRIQDHAGRLCREANEDHVMMHQRGVCIQCRIMGAHRNMMQHLSQNTNKTR